jgi:hypothetical protein
VAELAPPPRRRTAAPPAATFAFSSTSSQHILRIEVTGVCGNRLPRAQLASHDAESGRGLLLVEALADRWGVAPGPRPRKTVWAARFAERATRIAAALREQEAHCYLRRVRERVPDGRIVTRTISRNQPGHHRPDHVSGLLKRATDTRPCGT